MKNEIRKFLSQLSQDRGRKIRICFLGLGVTNLTIFEAIRTLPCLADLCYRQSHDIGGILQKGLYRVNISDSYAGVDVVFASPSVRREELPIPSDTVLTSDTDIFFAKRRNNLFLVSGSDGKSTVTELTSRLLFPSFPELFVGGNIGTPVSCASLDSDAFVLELSSFNLKYASVKGGRAALTNVTPNHLNWHSDLSEYQACKLRLIDSADESVLSLSCPFSDGIARTRHSFALSSDTLTHRQIKDTYSTEHTVTKEDERICIDGEHILSVGDILRKERHNVINLMSAIALTLGHTSTDRIRAVASTFAGLEHRCEVLSIHGITFINSSIDTTPERTKTTLLGLNKRVRLILGGRGKGLPHDSMKEPLLKYAERIAIYGETGDELSSWIESDPALEKICHKQFLCLYDAIDFACEGARQGDTVLLSPSATGYGEFRDFRDRGEFFKSYVKNKYEKI